MAFRRVARSPESKSVIVAATPIRHVVPGAAVALAAVVGAACGTAFSIAARIPASLSGRSDAVSAVRAANHAAPMSTPTARRMIAPLVAITEPTVAPMPQCTSGIAATCLK
jgi:hypothetical protein